MEEKKSDYFVVYTLKLMQWLYEKGISYKFSRLDKYNPKRLVWLYDNTQVLLDLIKEYKTSLQ